jgi:hypothetical protein
MEPKPLQEEEEKLMYHQGSVSHVQVCDELIQFIYGELLAEATNRENGIREGS